MPEQDEVLEADEITTETEEDVEDTSHDIIITGFPTTLANKVIPYKCGKCFEEFALSNAVSVDNVNFCIFCGTEFDNFTDLTA